ncbi:glycosyltransferase family 4 protein [Arenibaculum pallidiluteum]|uniref:glycosyltransferase family 4 protein n=1 Tax=Arenibaculum pallidiluteum TaxID=2812559 RepID=UPI001F43D437|nr:glycosyltransferase family 4 protein [Arenibaculum pallidiluteum]
MPSHPKLLYLVTEDWYFWSHRLPMARAAREAGFDVAVATRVAAHGERIAAEGFRLHPLRWRRRSHNPFAALAAIAEIAGLYRRERPDIVHHVALKPAVLGGIAAWIAGIPAVVGALTGLGFAFTDPGPRAAVIRTAITAVLRLLSRRHGTVLLLQNGDDLERLLALGAAVPGHTAVIRGSGIDLGRYPALPEPSGPVTVAYVGRMIAIKGLRTLVEAHRLLRARGSDTHLLLAGAPDPENPGSLPEDELRRLAAEPGITWRGHVDDIRTVWAEAHIAVQPSLGGEGLPKSLLEAAACGRPVIASDVPGCREIALPGVDGLRVPPGDPDALAAAIATLADDTALRARFGAAARHLVEECFDSAAIGAETVALYRRLLDGPAAPERGSG